MKPVDNFGKEFVKKAKESLAKQYGDGFTPLQGINDISQAVMYAVWTLDKRYKKYQENFPTFDVVVKAVAENDKFLNLVNTEKDNMFKLVSMTVDKLFEKPDYSDDQDKKDIVKQAVKQMHENDPVSLLSDQDVFHMMQMVF